MTTYQLNRELSDFTPQDDGDVGGDVQAGKSMSIRAVYEAVLPVTHGTLETIEQTLQSVAPYLVVTTYAYPVIFDSVNGGQVDVVSFLDDVLAENRKYGVDLQEEITLCTSYTDPGGTETWADIMYPEPDLHALVYFSESVEDAESRLADTLTGYARRDDCTPETLDMPPPRTLPT